MSVPTLEDFKQHLHIRHCHQDDDLQLKLDAAIDYASVYLGRPVPWLDSEGEPVPVPKSVFVAILMIAADLNANREQGFVGVAYAANPKVENMLHLYRAGMGI